MIQNQKIARFICLNVGLKLFSQQRQQQKIGVKIQKIMSKNSNKKMSSYINLKENLESLDYYIFRCESFKVCAIEVQFCLFSFPLLMKLLFLSKFVLIYLFKLLKIVLVCVMPLCLSFRGVHSCCWCCDTFSCFLVLFLFLFLEKKYRAVVC